MWMQEVAVAQQRYKESGEKQRVLIIGEDEVEYKSILHEIF